MKATRLLASAAILLIAAGSAHAQDEGDARGGLRYARQQCADCHAVEEKGGVSRDPDAPPFTEIAAWPRTTANLIAAWLITSHPTMPNFIINSADAADIVAYLMSLKALQKEEAR